jgi:hypothetical protein
MDDWMYAQKNSSERLARLHYFSVKKKHAAGEVEVRITVKEFATPEVGSLRFFAMADIPFDQVTKYQPSGWANSLLGALSECLVNCRKYPFEPAEAPSGRSETPSGRTEA